MHFAGAFRTLFGAMAGAARDLIYHVNNLPPGVVPGHLAPFLEAVDVCSMMSTSRRGLATFANNAVWKSLWLRDFMGKDTLRREHDILAAKHSQMPYRELQNSARAARPVPAASGAGAGDEVSDPRTSMV